jgi:5-(carboxyamino)imidazole ribonucleotide mutase
MAIGKSGAGNAGLFAVAILALGREDLAEQLVKWRAARAHEVLQQKLP